MRCTGCDCIEGIRLGREENRNCNLASAFQRVRQARLNPFRLFPLDFLAHLLATFLSDSTTLLYTHLKDHTLALA